MIAILLALGALGWANFNLNMFLNVMTPLIMVISFLGLDAADLRGARPADRGAETSTPRSRTPCWWSGRPAC